MSSTTIDPEATTANDSGHDAEASDSAAVGAAAAAVVALDGAEHLSEQGLPTTEQLLQQPNPHHPRPSSFAQYHNDATSPSSQSHQLSLESFDDESRIARAVAAATASALRDSAESKHLLSIQAIEGPPADRHGHIDDALSPLSTDNQLSPVSITSIVVENDRDATQNESATVPLNATTASRPADESSNNMVAVECCCGVMGRGTTLSPIDTVMTNRVHGNGDGNDEARDKLVDDAHLQTQNSIRLTETEDCDEEDEEEDGNVLKPYASTDNDTAAATPKRANHQSKLDEYDGDDGRGKFVSTNAHDMTGTRNVPFEHDAGMVHGDSGNNATITRLVNLVFPMDEHSDAGSDRQRLVTTQTASFEEETGVSGGVEIVMQDQGSIDDDEVVVDANADMDADDVDGLMEPVVLPSAMENAVRPTTAPLQSTEDECRPTSALPSTDSEYANTHALEQFESKQINDVLTRDGEHDPSLDDNLANPVDETRPDHSTLVQSDVEMAVAIASAEAMVLLQKQQQQQEPNRLDTALSTIEEGVGSSDTIMGPSSEIVTTAVSKDQTNMEIATVESAIVDTAENEAVAEEDAVDKNEANTADDDHGTAVLDDTDDPAVDDAANVATTEEQLDIVHLDDDDGEAPDNAVNEAAELDSKDRIDLDAENVVVSSEDVDNSVTHTAATTETAALEDGTGTENLSVERALDFSDEVAELDSEDRPVLDLENVAVSPEDVDNVTSNAMSAENVTLEHGTGSDSLAAELAPDLSAAPLSSAVPSCCSSMTGPLEVVAPNEEDVAATLQQLSYAPAVSDPIEVSTELIQQALDTNAAKEHTSTSNGTTTYARSESTGFPESSCCSSVTGPLELNELKDVSVDNVVPRESNVESSEVATSAEPSQLMVGVPTATTELSALDDLGVVDEVADVDAVVTSAETDNAGLAVATTNEIDESVTVETCPQTSAAEAGDDVPNATIVESVARTDETLPVEISATEGVSNVDSVKPPTNALLSSPESLLEEELHLAPKPQEVEIAGVMGADSEPQATSASPLVASGEMASSVEASPVVIVTEETERSDTCDEVKYDVLNAVEEDTAPGEDLPLTDRSNEVNLADVPTLGPIAADTTIVMLDAREDALSSIEAMPPVPDAEVAAGATSDPTVHVVASNEKSSSFVEVPPLESAGEDGPNTKDVLSDDLVNPDEIITSSQETLATPSTAKDIDAVDEIGTAEGVQVGDATDPINVDMSEDGGTPSSMDAPTTTDDVVDEPRARSVGLVADRKVSPVMDAIPSADVSPVDLVLPAVEAFSRQDPSTSMNAAGEVNGEVNGEAADDGPNETASLTPESIPDEVNVVSADKPTEDCVNQNASTEQNSTEDVEATTRTTDVADICGHVVSPLATADTAHHDAVPLHEDLSPQLSAQVPDGKIEQECPVAIAPPVRESEPVSVKIEPGTVAPYSDFVSQQSNQIKLDKEKERATRKALNSPVQEQPRQLSVEVGVVAPYNDFVTNQSAQIKANKQKERETRQALSSPAQAEYGKVSKSSVSGAIAPYVDFAAQQSAQIKENKQKEREARESLSSPAQAVLKGKASLSPGAGIVAPFSDFTSHQSAQIRASKEKEREARQSLSAPARASPQTPLSNGVLAPFTDFTTQQSAQIKADKDKERETRQEMNRPLQGASIDQHAAELHASNLEQKRKQKEAKETMAAYRTADATSGDLQSSMAAELKRQQEEQKQKKKEAEEMVLSYRNADPTITDSQSRLAATLKQQEMEEKRRKKEAEESRAMYRAADPTSVDAASRAAAKIRAAKEEEARKKKEADELMKSYKSSHVGVDAASQAAVSISTLREEQRQKKKEAEELAQSYRTTGTTSGTAQEILAAELKRQRNDEKLRKKEAQDIMIGFRSTPLGVTSSLHSDTAPSAADIVAVTSPRSLDDLRTRTDDEIRATSELRKQHTVSIDDDSASATNTLESLKSKTTSELAALQGNVSNLKSLTEGFDAGTATYSVATVQTSAQREIAKLKQSGTNLRSLAGAYDRGIASKAVEKVKLQTQEELNALQGHGFSLKTLTEEFTRGIPSESVEKLKIETGLELSSIQGSNTAKKLAAAFGRGIQTDSVEKVKSKTEQELASLQSKGVSRLSAAWTENVTPKASDGSKSQAANELASLSRSTSGSVMKKMAEKFETGTVAPSGDDGSALSGRGAGSGKKFTKAATEATPANVESADDVASLSGKSTESVTKKLADKFDSGPSPAANGGKVNDFKQPPASDMPTPRGTSSLKERMQMFNQAATNSRLDQQKSSTSAELAGLRKGNGLRSLKDGFNQGMKSSKAEELKSQAAAELQAVQQEQTRKKKEIDASLAASTESKPPPPAAAVIFTEAELAAFETERNLRQQELDQLKGFASDKKLDAMRSRAAAELAELKQRRKEQK